MKIKQIDHIINNMTKLHNFFQHTGEIKNVPEFEFETS